MINAILDPFAINTNFKNPFPELNKTHMGLEMSVSQLEPQSEPQSEHQPDPSSHNTWTSTSPINLVQIRNGLCLSTTPISLNAMRQWDVLVNANPMAPPNVPTTGAISLGDFRGEMWGCNPY